MKYDFIDFGCKHGGSISYCKNKYGLKNGLGVDLDPNNIKIAKSKGYDVICADAIEYIKGLDDNYVEYITAVHFLEHLPSIEVAKDFIREALRVTTKGVYVIIPYFDDEEELGKMGFRLSWQNWKGHTAHLTSNDFKEFNCKIKATIPITSTESEWVVTTDAPEDTLWHRPDLGTKLVKPLNSFKQLEVEIYDKS